MHLEAFNMLGDSWKNKFIISDQNVLLLIVL
jgi:hypothetical protein